MILAKGRPFPQGPWVMTQRWADCLFLHWSLDPAAVRPLVPEALDLDLREGRAWVGVTPMVVSVRPRGLPSVPFASTFAELNVRTYVRHKGEPGVYFLSLEAASLPAVMAARLVYRLNYRWAGAKVKRAGTALEFRVGRRSGSKDVGFRVKYRPYGPAALAREGSLDEFLVERYRLFAVSGGKVSHADVDHLRWRLQDVEASVLEDTLTASLGLALPPEPSLARYSALQDVRVWGPKNGKH